MSKQIDPRTTRKSVRYENWARNSALYAHYKVVQVVKDAFSEKPSSVIVELKPEHCGTTRH